MNATALRTLLAGLALAGVTAAAPAPAAAASGHRTSRARAHAARLHRFDDCAELVRYARGRAAHGGTRVGAGMPPRPVVQGRPVIAPGPAPAEGQGAPGATQVGVSPTASAPAAPDFSQTNVQEAGVDEPDVVKTDGRTVFVVNNNHVVAVDGRAATPVVLGTLDLPGTVNLRGLLLDGDRLLVVADEYGSPPPVAARAHMSVIALPGRTLLATVDVSNPGAMRVLSTEAVDGGFVDARQVGSIARVVVASTPRAIEAPAEQTRPAGWLPRATIRARGAAKATVRRAVGCSSVRRPRAFSGLGMMSILTVDLRKGLPAIDADAVMTDAQTVYGSPTRLYVATQRWVDPRTPQDDLPSTATTQIHEFRIENEDETTYRGSGEVAGTLLNSYSMSLDKGVLRVATTAQPPWDPQFAQSGLSQSAVTTLALQDQVLVRLGRVTGLGRGERIYAVRFLGDMAYVVTFRQIDPLHVVDLSDPRDPRLRGVLELEGYSAYLHPLGGDLLLGVGQDATPSGRQAGTQLSLFDVGDPAHPRRLAQLPLGGGSSSQVEYDPHAFLWWAPERLAVIPVTRYPGPTGAVGVEVDRAKGLTIRGTVSHPGGTDPGGAPSIDRSLVMGARLLTTSFRGLQANRLSDLAPVGFAAFPQPATPPGPQPLAATGTAVP